MTSFLGHVCPTADLIVSPIHSWALKAGMRIDTKGFTALHGSPCGIAFLFFSIMGRCQNGRELRHDWDRPVLSGSKEASFSAFIDSPAYSMPRPDMPRIGWMRTGNALSSQSGFTKSEV